MLFSDLIPLLWCRYRMPAPANCPKSLHTLMLRCWDADRRSRVPFTEVVVELTNRHTELSENGCVDTHTTFPALFAIYCSLWTLF
jgi:hypothetical protein